MAERVCEVAVPRNGEKVTGALKGELQTVQIGDVQKVTVGSVAVPCGVLKTRKRIRMGKEGLGARVGGSRPDGRPGKIREQEVVNSGGGKGKVRVEEMSAAGKPKQSTLPAVTPATQFIPVFRSCKEDRAWENSGMVAHIKAADSTLSFQQRIEDAGFPSVIVTPLGGDRVFLRCTDGEAFSTVLTRAPEFFGTLFYNFHKWSDSLIRYERGAWLRVYGIPVHAWNDTFFRICVSGIGRFLYVDECTADKARLDFARILVVTPEIEIVNKLSDFIIDGRQYALKLVEEWGCNLGEDAFTSDEATKPFSEDRSEHFNPEGLDEVQDAWDLDDLVTDLQNEWCKHENTIDGKTEHNVDVTYKNMAAPNSGAKDVGSEFFEVQLSPILQPVPQAAASANDIVEPGTKQGPWSLDWIENHKTILEGGVIFSSSSKEDTAVKRKSK